MSKKQNLKRLFVISIVILMITGIFLYSPKTSSAQDINIKNFCTAVKNYINEKCPPISGRGPYQCSSPFDNSPNIYLKLRDYSTNLYSAGCDISRPLKEQEARDILNKFFSEYCTQDYAKKDTVLNFFCQEWENPTENGQNIINASVKPGAERVPGGGTYLISQYEVGQKIGKDLAETNTNCTVDADIGLIDFFKNPISWFFRLIFWIFARILEFIAYAFLYVLTPKNFGGFVNFPPVQTIWTIARNLANLGIILGFVFTAIATILKIEKYSWEKMLWRLVLVALLVNFSLVICGMFVDLSNFLITFFINGADKQIINFPTLLSYTAAKIACSGVGQGFWYEAATAVIGIIVAIVFIGQVIGLIIYAVTRIVTLWLTLGLSPLGFLSLAFPGAEKIANTWKNYFTQALISLPIIAFSFFIVLVMLNAVATSYFMPITTTEGKTFVQNVVAILAYGVIIIILSQATLVIAGAIGIQQVQKGYQWVNKIVWGALGATGGYALGKATKGLTSSASWKATAEKWEKSNVAALHNLGITMKQITQKTRSGEIKQAEERAATMSEEELRREGEYFVKHHDYYRAKVFYDELAKKQKIDTKKDKENISILKDYINPALLKKANPILFLENFGKKEEIDEIRNKAKQIAQGDEVKERMEYQRMLTEKFISEAEEKDLSDTPWEKVLEFNPYSDKELATFTEAQRQAIEARVPGLQQEARTKLFADLAVNKEVTADGLANIYRKFDSGKVMQHTNELLKGIEEILKGKPGKPGEPKKFAREYLTEDLGYQYNLYWQNILKRATKTSGGSTPPTPPPPTPPPPTPPPPTPPPPPPRPSNVPPSWKWHPPSGKGKGFWAPAPPPPTPPPPPPPPPPPRPSNVPPSWKWHPPSGKGKGFWTPG